MHFKIKSSTGFPGVKFFLHARNMFYKGHLIRATLLTSLGGEWNLGPSLILQKISRATPGWHSSIIDSFSAPISHNMQHKWLVRQTSCLLRQFWPLPRKSHLHAERAAVHYVKNGRATLRAKTSFIPEKFRGQLVSNFTVALIKQVACSLFGENLRAMSMLLESC